MDFAAIIDGVESFAAYVGELASVIGHVGRVAPLHDYCAGLLASEGRRCRTDGGADGAGRGIGAAFAALEVATGTIIAAHSKRRRHQTILRYTREAEAVC
jgi:SRSO17 transposase